MFGKLKNIWAWFDGKKTWLGVACLGVGYGMEYLGWNPEIAKILKDLGTALGGLGIIHKVFKAGEAKGIRGCQ